jgi:Na+-transporting methylmalonyl-CoA/oxaloacetate decarboxylase gamma subunit
MAMLKKLSEKNVFNIFLTRHLYCFRVFGKVKSRSAHMKIHRPDQDKEKEKKAKLAKQQAAAAAAAAASSNVDPVHVEPLAFSALPNGPSQL